MKPFYCLFFYCIASAGKSQGAGRDFAMKDRIMWVILREAEGRSRIDEIVIRAMNDGAMIVNPAALSGEEVAGLLLRAE